MPESPTESARAQGAPTEPSPPDPPPLGKPIHDEPPAPDGQDTPREGEHVVITPQTAGSAGAAHPSDTPEEN